MIYSAVNSCMLNLFVLLLKVYKFIELIIVGRIISKLFIANNSILEIVIFQLKLNLNLNIAESKSLGFSNSIWFNIFSKYL